ncbi:hypothetical protein FFF34_002725 [Inquilinus sp. KBS0705]|nr:hypothetical protein FFF34_002725 [Inquilinus sp. KBS0705]
MKKPLFLLFATMIISLATHAQSNDQHRLKGSWSGKLVIPNGPTLTIIINFKDKTDASTFDVPEQLSKDGFIDSVWTVKDSVFADLSTRLGKGSMYKGVLSPGDSLIRGNWIQGALFPLTLKPTDDVFTLKSRMNPKFEGYKILKLIASTPTKDQQNTGTCWSHATTSFIETEAIRIGKKPVVLSPMFYVIPTLMEKAERYVRMQGNIAFNEGDLTFSALKAYKTYGAIPEVVYSGKIDSRSIHEHLKMELAIKDKLKRFIDEGRGVMTPEGYRNAVSAIIYKTMAKAPAAFDYKGKSYTAKSFAKENIGIDPEDYVEVTSYTHHPFYKKFPLEIGSNWNGNAYLNVPLNDFTAIIDHALLNNYSVCWDGDIHEGYQDGFCRLAKDEKITQQARQTAFDNYTTQDDHNMHIIGMAEDKEGKKFYIAKNSSAGSDCGGYVYMSKDYLLLKTISVMVHKDAFPKEMVAKLKPVR